MFIKHTYNKRVPATHFDPENPAEIEIHDIFLNEESIYDLIGEKQLEDIYKLIYENYEN